MVQALQKILVIDDENDVRMISKLTLKKKGSFDVQDKSSGAEALAYLQGLATENLPDLILLDVMMPDMDGPNTLAEIQKMDGQTAQIPVIFLTAKCQPDEVERLKNLGAADVIGKPYDVQTLSDQVQEIWRDLSK